MERRAVRINGFVVLLALIVPGAALAAVWLTTLSPTWLAIGIAWLVLAALVATGFTVVNPNEAKVVQFLGRYVGSVSDAGLQWVLPLTTKHKITLRVRNFETSKLKVNDADGNPVEIAAVVVYKVVDTAKAVFAVDDYEEYVAIQSEAAVRHLATTHPYDSHDADRTSLRDGAEVAEELTAELRDRTELAGIEVIEARITHLAYAPEIAQAMLRPPAGRARSSRPAPRSSRARSAWSQLALDRLAEEGVVDLDEERKAQMVSNLLVVLCGDRATQPVVNAGSSSHG